MKTYIWHFEYDYIAVMEDSKEKAFILANKIYEEKRAGGWQTELGTYRAKVLDNGDLNPEPSYILNPGEAKVFEHGNE